tara:strand:- start:215 stop:637 length:423 start_codon:yes stop_codon:yes gene_type:complete
MENLNAPLQVDFIPMEYSSPKKVNNVSYKEHQKGFLNAIADGYPIEVRTTHYHQTVKITLIANGYKYPNPNVVAIKSPYKTKSIEVSNKELNLFIPSHNQRYIEFIDHLHFLFDTLFRGVTPKVKALVISTKIIVKLQNF